jgi:hypothetical protein
LLYGRGPLAVHSKMLARGTGLRGDASAPG